jgi:hypothetical protein
MNDPGMFTDGTGDGMGGDTDVSLLTQKNLKETYYNGSKPCSGCGSLLDPFTALHTERCTKCNNRKSQALLKNRMVE